MQGKIKTEPEWMIFANKKEIQTLMKALTNANYHHEDFLKDKSLPADVVKHHQEQIELNNKMFKDLAEVIKT